MDLQAYFEEWSCQPGDVARLAISTPHKAVRASLVRLISGPGQGDKVEGRVIDFSSVLDRSIAGRLQPTMVGSYAEFPLPAPLRGRAVSIHCWAWPTVPDREMPQAIWSLGELALVIGSGGLALRAKDETLAILSEAMVAKHWYSILVTIGDGTASIDLKRLDGKINAHQTISAATGASATADRLLLAASGIDPTGSPLQPYNGKIDSPTLHLAQPSVDSIAAWHAGTSPALFGWAAWKLSEDFAAETIAPDFAGGTPGRLVNGVERGVTGRNWDGRSDSFIDVPQHYRALQFHDDDMVDAGWDYDLEITLPDTLPSGIYSVRLEAGPSRNHFPLFVRPKPGSAAPVLFLAPTNTYLAYANETLSFDAQIIQPMTGQPPVVTDLDVETYEHREYGLSTYDHYEDDAGVCFSSYLRPIINMRPKYRMSSMNITWQFPADLSIVAWIDHMGYDCDFVTDEDLHREGADLLRPYLCVITGTHPEYVSEKMLDAQEDYVVGGGRLIYMGGNGYYWVVGFDSEMPACMEVRKLDSGMRAWAAKPGEHYLQTTGEKSGLWRNRGRAPQKLTGVGFIAEGFETSAPYRKMPDAWHRTVSWITEGVEGEIFGDKGLAYNAAAGVELDRYDLSLGTPPHTKIIASSGGHSDNYVLVTEELLYAYAGLTGSLDYRIRADMTYFTAPDDGAVFSTGSIAYGQALPANGFNNSAARLLANVVNAFLKPGRLPGGNWTIEEKQWR